MSESSYSREKVIGKNKTALECLKLINTSEFISWGNFKTKLFMKNAFLTKNGNYYSLKTKRKQCQLCIDYQ